ncbi:MAG: 7-carboxy-7-deazaguanine synthase QueE, partial [Bdellovibrionales bacterium]|nr:7-carboxy-7-deazaguanine synthase QueE [Bdellovibrionales bacterium]
LSSCNLRCEWLKADGKTNLCDTAYSSHFPENEKRNISEVLEAMDHFKCKHVVITGGEPYLQPQLPALIEEIKKRDHFVTVETNGTIYMPTKADFISLSPKLASSCVKTSPHFNEHQKHRLNMGTLVEFIIKHDFQFKFVVNDPGDIKEIEGVQKYLEGFVDESFTDKIYLMPQAITKDELMKSSLEVADWAKTKSWNYTDRLHLRLWGPKRGV